MGGIVGRLGRQAADGGVVDDCAPAGGGVADTAGRPAPRRRLVCVWSRRLAIIDRGLEADEASYDGRPWAPPAGVRRMADPLDVTALSHPK